MPASLSWRRGGAAAIVKPRYTFSVSLCFIDVSDCARLRPFRLSGPCGGECAKQLGNPDDGLLPTSSRACVLQLQRSWKRIDVKINGRSEPQKIKGPRGGFSSGIKPRNVNAKDVPPRFPE